jgi:hypothetical protein
MRKALVVGLQNYLNTPLKGCIDDAKEINDLLSFNEDNTANFGCKLLTDEEKLITRKQLKTHITDLFNAKGYEAVLLYFSGHGNIDISGGCIAASDFREDNEGVSMADILTLANKSEALHKIIILDCCYSGEIAVPQNNNSNKNEIEIGLTILTASLEDQPAVQQTGQGVFTRLLIEALKGAAADLCGNVSAGSIYAFIDKAMGQWGQRPVFKTNVNTFLPIRKVKPPIPLEILKKITDYFIKPKQEYPLDPSYEFTAPEHKDENVAKFKDLQKLVSVGVVKPVGEEHMYFAAMNKKACKLTVLGQCYWQFVKDGKI